MSGLRYAAALLSIAGCAAVSRQAPGSASESLALVGGTIYVSPAEEPLRDGVILVRDGVIAAVGSKGSLEIPPTAEVLDCSGLTVTAGFWNSHVHFFESKWENAGAIPGPDQADLVLLRADPALDVLALAEVQATLGAGRILFPDAGRDP